MPWVSVSFKWLVLTSAIGLSRSPICLFVPGRGSTLPGPNTFWNTAVPKEYGFYANVNPKLPHARWSQAVEQLIPNMERVATQPYNGYGKWVAHMYNGSEI